ncbi:MAG: RNA-directed polymerase [Acidimicrobiaceae bacterium]|jgi:hypothetical protein
MQIDPWRRMSCAPPSAATAASKRPPSRSPITDPLAPLADDATWHTTVEAFRARAPRRAERIADYERLIETGAHHAIAEAVLAETYTPNPPAEGWLNKADGRKKRIFRYPPADELLFRTVNRLLQPAALAEASPWCRSFLPGGGARTSFRAVLADAHLADKAVLRFDVRDYFNSIDVDDLLRALPEPLDRGPTGALLANGLRERRVTRDGVVVEGHQKGVMAGTPIAPMLATLYLRDLDDEVASHPNVTYARYSDDILVAAPTADIAGLTELVRARITERGLVVNEAKSSCAQPGEPWDFLGFRHADGRIGLAPITEHKLKTRATRLARSLLRWRDRVDASPDRVVGAFVRKTNRRLYGVPTERADFSWATWFLPMLDDPTPLGQLDAHVQREARYAATGKRTPRARATVAYGALTEAGHVPLVAAYWAMRDSTSSYNALIERRVARGCRPRSA